MNPIGLGLCLGLALSRSADTQEQAKQLHQEVIIMAPGVHDAYIELIQLLEPSEPQAAVEVYCRFPLKLRRRLHHRRDRPPADDAGAVRPPAAGPQLHARSVYARLHDRQEDDQDLQDFFKFKCWM